MKLPDICFYKMNAGEVRPCVGYDDMTGLRDVLGTKFMT